MGYKLNGNSIEVLKKAELVSSPVCFGTVQLLPDGQLVLLMADHQTTGGYPRIAHVITAHHSAIAQKNPGDVLRFKMTDMITAEKLLFQQENELEILSNIIKMKLNDK
jgi:antagonist of KipI